MVLRSQGYKQLLQRYHALQAGACSPPQFTVLLILPSTIDLAAVPPSRRSATVDRVGHGLGIGYARLGIQLIACWMGLKTVWLMDDNVQDCYRLRYEHMLKHGKHEPLERVSFGVVMKTIEKQVSCKAVGGDVCPAHQSSLT